MNHDPHEHVGRSLAAGMVVLAIVPIVLMLKLWTAALRWGAGPAILATLGLALVLAFVQLVLEFAWMLWREDE
jgi:hypothetical protein